MGVSLFPQIKRENVAALLEIVRLYSEKTVVPVPELVSSIAEMGFEEENVREALIATQNNQTAAVSVWPGIGNLPS